LEAPALHTLCLIARQPWRHWVTSLRSAHWMASSLKLAALWPVSECWPSCFFMATCDVQLKIRHVAAMSSSNWSSIIKWQWIARIWSFHLLVQLTPYRTNLLFGIPRWMMAWSRIVSLFRLPMVRYVPLIYVLYICRCDASVCWYFYKSCFVNLTWYYDAKTMISSIGMCML